MLVISLGFSWRQPPPAQLPTKSFPMLSPWARVPVSGPYSVHFPGDAACPHTSSALFLGHCPCVPINQFLTHSWDICATDDKEQLHSSLVRVLTGAVAGLPVALGAAVHVVPDADGLFEQAFDTTEVHTAVHQALHSTERERSEDQHQGHQECPYPDQRAATS